MNKKRLLHRNTVFYVAGAFLAVFVLFEVFSAYAVLGKDWTQLPNTNAVAQKYSTATVIDNKIWVLGGYNGAILSALKVYDGNAWSNAPATMQPIPSRYGHTAVAYDNKLYAFGGMGISGVLNDLRYFDPSDTGWPNSNWHSTNPATKPPARYYHASVVFDNKIWVIGGYDGYNSLKDVWTYDGTTWAKQADFPGTSRYAHTAVVYDNKIYVMGGYTTQFGGAVLSDVWSYDSQNGWVQSPVTGFTRKQFASALVFDNKIWVIGGDGPDTTSIGTIYYFNGASWNYYLFTSPTAGQTLPAYRSGHTSAVYDKKIYVMGGYYGNYLSDVWYSPSDIWP